MNKTIRNSLEIVASIQDINAMIPGLKETEVISYAYKIMAQDISNNVVEVSVWDDMLKLDFGDKEKKLEFSETRGCYVADADFEIVINKNKKYPAAYLNRENVNRAPLAYVTNAIESLNSTYRKLNRQRSVFPSDTALLKALYLATFEATKKYCYDPELGSGLWRAEYHV